MNTRRQFLITAPIGVLGVDLLLVPSLRDEMPTISNFTGHPSLTPRAGFVHVSEGTQRLGAGSGESGI